ncbi:Uncharacterised protein [Mycobacterium tuberculosis]|uniref:Uncharacterized protein n=1 Tax=Mycobacterium tuberculosis TaxID=1773 RepID=A0A655DEP0_MYCTX|nr:Uncharacterised protein [Mycobacterium tuberculosis]CNV50895.1 Uncharacterised protein [Mycobacterium tuberculosis]
MVRSSVTIKRRFGSARASLAASVSTPLMVAFDSQIWALSSSCSCRYTIPRTYAKSATSSGISAGPIAAVSTSAPNRSDDLLCPITSTRSSQSRATRPCPRWAAAWAASAQIDAVTAGMTIACGGRSSAAVDNTSGHRCVTYIRNARAS